MPYSRYKRPTIAPIFLVFSLFCQVLHAEWVQTLTADGPRTPKIFSLVVAGPHLLAGFESGVFRSSDQGNSWTHLQMRQPSNPSVLSMAASDSTVFAATGSGGVYRSTDYGLTWTQSGLVGKNVFSIVLIVDAVFALTHSNGIFRSIDAGTTWTRQYAGIPKINSITVSGEFLYGGSADGLHRSSDQGISWMRIPFAAGLSDSAVYSPAVLGTKLFASASKALYRSGDNGGTWTKVPLEVTNNPRIIASGRTLFVKSHSQLFSSSDGGHKWVSIESGLASSSRYPPNIQCLAVDSGFLFAGVSSEGVWRRPLSEVTKVIIPNRDSESRSNSGVHEYFGTPGLAPGMFGILQTGPTSGLKLNGRAIPLPENTSGSYKGLK